MKTEPVEILKKIAMRISGINKLGLTKAERYIADVLAEEGIAEWHDPIVRPSFSSKIDLYLKIKEENNNA